ncbi:hypothetical protein FH972_025540 [Carpinus fangiana]|uniref:Isopenicillin N synthase-like Fe(2+) 2OG dioxygenase domain-containing protein n=1 Tax=Carpinus fangiana TaxID=176857 RepID=A0A5N6L1B6_9ROSI|nr:hypothetical protein FH972_025540 [Carpinus fangiana]
MSKLCSTVLDVVAATPLYGPCIFDEFQANEPACPLRLLHYPPTPTHVPGKKRQLGASAHTDFGAVILLLQDEHPGLEVLDQEMGGWVGVPPRKGACDQYERHDEQYYSWRIQEQRASGGQRSSSGSVQYRLLL